MTAHSKQPKTQRAWRECVHDDGSFSCDNPRRVYQQEPVLVVPEAAVKGCKHDDPAHWTVGYRAKWCPDCGALKDGNGRWQRPRILQVPR